MTVMKTWAERYIDADCRTGKHRACIGYLWNDELNDYQDCECECHIDVDDTL